jgi:hypothetical protein
MKIGRTEQWHDIDYQVSYIAGIKHHKNALDTVLRHPEDGVISSNVHSSLKLRSPALGCCSAATYSDPFCGPAAISLLRTSYSINAFALAGN